MRIVLLICALALLVGTASAGDEGIISAGLKENAGGVFVLPAGTYTLTGDVEFPENTELRGEVSDDDELLTKIVLDDQLSLDEQEPVLKIKSGCKVKYIDFFGDESRQKRVPMRNGKRWGLGYHNFIGAYDSSNIEVSYCNFYANLGDGLRATNCKGVSFHDNTASKGGHDVLFAIRSENVEVYNNYVEPRVNSAFRFMDVSHGRIYNNTIVFKSVIDGKKIWAGPAIQIQNDKGVMKDVEVCGNYIFGSWGPGFWIVGKTSDHSQELWIHHNVIYNGGSDYSIYWVGGVIESGYDNVLFENNVFDGCYLGAVNFWAYSNAWGSSATATLRNNIFVNSVPNRQDKIGGWGVNNEISGQRVISEGNCYYNNEAGNTRGCSVSGSDYFTDPKTSETLCEVKWDGDAWVIEGVEPKALGDFEGVYDDMEDITDEEIEAFEFQSIFSILDVGFYAGAASGVSMPVDYEPIDSCTVAVYDNEYQPQTRYYVEYDNFTSKIVYTYQNTSSTHYLWTRYSASGLSSGYENLDTWELEGDASRLGDVYIIPGAVNESAQPVAIETYDLSGKKTEVNEFNTTVYKENLTGAISPYAYLFVAMIAILCAGIILNISVAYGKFKRRYYR